MSLIKCTECSRLVSNKAVACPACGNPVVAATSEVSIESKSGDVQSNQALSIAVVMVILVVFAFITHAFNPTEEAHRAKLRGAIAQAHPVASLFGAAYLGALDVRYSDGVFMSGTFRGSEIVTFGMFGVVIVVGRPLA